MQAKSHARAPVKEDSTEPTPADAAGDPAHESRTETRLRIGHNPLPAGRSTTQSRSSVSRPVIATPSHVAPTKKNMPPSHLQAAYRFSYPCDL